MKIKIKAENYGTKITVTDKDGNDLGEVLKIEIDPIIPKENLITAKIYIAIKELEIEAE